MTAKLKILFVLALSGLLLGALPATWLYGAGDEQAGPPHHEAVASVSVQFVLVHIERDTLERLMDESDTQTLDSIPLEKIGQCVRKKDGAKIVSQTRLAVVTGFEAHMTVADDEDNQTKNLDKENAENAHGKAEVSVKVSVEHCDGQRLGVRFEYNRTVSRTEYVMGHSEEQEEGIEHRFSLSSGVLLQPGHMQAVGACMNEDLAMLLLMKADI